MDRSIMLDDYRAASRQLQLALALEATNDVLKAGCIQYFEFCFELAWKTIKAIAEEHGVQECNSPKSALKYAFKNGWLREEEIWLDMIKSRNRMSHTYNARSALEVYQKLEHYCTAFVDLQNELAEAD